MVTIFPDCCFILFSAIVWQTKIFINQLINKCVRKMQCSKICTYVLFFEKCVLTYSILAHVNNRIRTFAIIIFAVTVSTTIM